MNITPEQIAELEKMPHLKTHIKKLMTDGGYARYSTDIMEQSLWGLCETPMNYVIVSTTDDAELCMIAFKDKRGAKEHLTRREGNWEVESIWHNDKKLKFGVTPHIE